MSVDLRGPNVTTQVKCPARWPTAAPGAFGFSHGQRHGLRRGSSGSPRPFSAPRQATRGPRGSRPGCPASAARGPEKTSRKPGAGRPRRGAARRAGGLGPGRTPGFGAAHPRRPAPGPRRPTPARGPSIPHPERPTHRLLHGGRHLGTGLRRAARRAARARPGPGPSLAPRGPGPPRKYSTASIFLPAASSTRDSQRAGLREETHPGRTWNCVHSCLHSAKQDYTKSRKPLFGTKYNHLSLV
nr:translation initiation factor IF-2-like [Mirounga angustirostris]